MDRLTIRTVRENYAVGMSAFTGAFFAAGERSSPSEIGNLNFSG